MFLMLVIPLSFLCCRFHFLWDNFRNSLTLTNKPYLPSLMTKSKSKETKTQSFFYRSQSTYWPLLRCRWKTIDFFQNISASVFILASLMLHLIWQRNTWYKRLDTGDNLNSKKENFDHFLHINTFSDLKKYN